MDEFDSERVYIVSVHESQRTVRPVKPAKPNQEVQMGFYEFFLYTTNLDIQKNGVS